MNEQKKPGHLSSPALFTSTPARFLMSVFIFFCALTALAPEKARAQAFVPVFDNQNFFVNSTTAANTTELAQKELLTDGIFNMAAKLVIQNITDSIVRWINSGFQGSPAFITDPDAFFTDVADQVAGNYIAGTELDFLCSPFALDIRAALNFNYSSKHRIVCRLTDAIKNVQDFTKFTQGDFNQGGWDGWFSMTQNQENNPYGAYAQAQGELTLRISAAQGREFTLASWGRGFMSWKDADGKIQTPGSVIESQINQVLPAGMQELQLADEFNEIVGALMGQLVQQVLIGGLSSVRTVKDNTYQNKLNQLNGSCAPDVATAKVGDLVGWRAFRSEGNASSYTYTWSGDAPLEGRTGQSINVQYTTPGVKRGSVRIGGGSGLNSVTCDSTVTVTR